MGMRFDLNTANWVAYIIQPDINIPSIITNSEARETLRLFFNQLEDRFLSNEKTEEYFRNLVRRSFDRLFTDDNLLTEGSLIQVIQELRRFFIHRPWTALIVPSHEDTEVNNYLCSKRYLRDLVQIRTYDPGLILQLESPPKKEFSILGIFPAFKVALVESHRWPGILIWSKQGDSIFLPYESKNISSINNCSRWIFSNLSSTIGLDLRLFKEQYYGMFAGLREKHKPSLYMLQLSDLHIGDKVANRRLPRIQRHVENVLSELDDDVRVLPIISGDLMDTPNEACLDGVRLFLSNLSTIMSEKPIIVLGNHDVRKMGFLRKKFKSALQLNQENLTWLDEEKIGIVCFNSVIEGNFARGSIGERQFIDLGNEIDKKENHKDYSLISILHHHPVSVETPNWYYREFLEKIIGGLFEKTLELEDAPKFMEFIETRDFAFVMHGHKHIPRFTKTDIKNIPIFGCGSTSGKVKTTDGSIYMSLNLYSIDSVNKKITARLLAERMPGAGLVESNRHEFVYRS